MAKTSQQQKRTLGYEDTPLKPDFTKKGSDFVDDLLKQLPIPPIPEKQNDE